MRTLHLLLSLREGRSLNLLEARLATEGQRIRSRLPAGPRSHRRGIRLPDDPFGAVEHGAAVRPGFEAVLEASVPDDADPADLVKAVEGAGSRLAEWIEPERSAAMIGRRHVIVGGEAPVWLVYAMRRLASLSPEAFRDHWLNKHADLGRAVPGLRGYCQVHADLEASRAAARVAGLGVDDLDGIAEGYFADPADFVAVMSQPEVAADALEDEKLFIDHARTSAALTRVAYQVVDPH